MTTEVTITGTGTPAPTPGRVGPGVLVRYGQVALQFDAGRGTSQRLIEAGVQVTDLSAFFATHHHSDHLTGLQDIVLTRWVLDFMGSLDPLPLIVPAGASEAFARTMLDCWAEDIKDRAAHSGTDTIPRTEIIPFDLPASPVEVWRSGDVRVLAGPVRHQPLHPAVGYRIETPDGVVVITGDTIVCDEVEDLAVGADILVYEATRFDAVRENMPPFVQFILDYHADAELVGAQAASLEVDALVLTHLIPPPQTEQDRTAFADQVVGNGYEGLLIVADDLDTIVLENGLVSATVPRPVVVTTQVQGQSRKSR